MARIPGIPLTLRILVALLVIQGLTVLLYVAWTRSGSTDSLLAFTLLAIVAAFFAALWLASMAHRHHGRDLQEARAALLRERERGQREIREHAAETRETLRRQLLRDLGRRQTRDRLKLYAALGGMGFLGVLLVLMQFLSLGIVLLSASGGTVAGYLLRLRQESKRRGAEEAAAADRPPPRIVSATRDTLPGRAQADESVPRRTADGVEADESDRDANSGPR